MEFPEKIYTHEEIRLARSLIEGGYRHRLRIVGSKAFKEMVREALKLIRRAGYYDFVRANLRMIKEIDGFSQLREADATLWANTYVMRDPVNAASFIFQKAWQMSEYLMERRHYGHIGETLAINMRVRFLKRLRDRIRDPEVKAECERKLKLWDEGVLL